MPINYLVCASTGSHYNPFNKTHGFLENPIRHNGDFGNLMVDENGTIVANLEDNKMTLYGKHSIIGRSLVLHEGEDDGGLSNTELSRSTGSSGARIACGMIGILKLEQKKKIVLTSFSIIKRRLLPSSEVVSFSYNDSSINISFPTPASDSENVTLDTQNITVTNILDQISKSIPQIAPVFDLFYKTVSDVLDLPSSVLNESQNKTESVFRDISESMESAIPLVRMFLKRCIEKVSLNN